MKCHLGNFMIASMAKKTRAMLVAHFIAKRRAADLGSEPN
jgi:hypothetical protein